MAEIKLNKRYKYAGDIFPKLIDIGFDIETATSFLNDIKDADVEEVVRCKDCVYSKKDKYHKVTVVCNRFKTGEFTHRMQPMNFCSYGERTPQKEG